MEVCQIFLQCLSIVLPRDPIDPDRRRLLQLKERPSQRIDIRMV
jgi:hypothetical protein